MNITPATPPRPSTAHITIPVAQLLAAPPVSTDAPNQVDPSSTVADALVARLPALLASFGPDANKHVLATVLITECIEAGFDTRAKIRSIAARSPLNPSQVVIVLKNATGTDPERHEWSCDDDGRYVLPA